LKDEVVITSHASHGEPHQSIHGWQPPPYGFVKVNWDASLNIKENYIQIGIVVTDYNGDFLGARAVTKLAMGAPKVAEAIAALEAVLFRKEVHFFFLKKKCDCRRRCKANSG